MPSRIQDYNTSKDNSFDLKTPINSFENYDSFRKLLRECLLNQDYEKADRLLCINNAFIENLNEDEKAPCIAIRIYISIMLRKFDSAVSEAEKLANEYPSSVSKMIFTFCLIRTNKIKQGIFALDNLEKENINEPNFLIMVYFFRSLVFFSLKDNESGFEEYKKFNEIFQEHHVDFRKIPEYYHMRENVKILMENPSEYSLVLSDELPPPPELDEEDPEKVSFIINLNYKIISNKDGSVVYFGSIGL